MESSCYWSRLDIIISMFSYTIASLTGTRSSSTILFYDVEFIFVAPIHCNCYMTIWIAFVCISEDNITSIGIVAGFVYSPDKLLVQFSKKIFGFNTHLGRSSKYKRTFTLMILGQIVLDQICTLIAIHLIIINHLASQARTNPSSKCINIDHCKIKKLKMESDVIC